MSQTKKSAVTTVITVFCIFAAIKYFFVPCMPFALGAAVAYASLRMAGKLGIRGKKAKKRVAALFSVVIYSAFISLAVLFGKMIYGQISGLYGAWLRGEGKISELIDTLRRMPEIISIKLFPGAPEDIGETLSSLIKSLTDETFSAVSSFLGRAAAFVPSVLFFSFVTILSGILFCLCRDEVSAFVSAYLPKLPDKKGLTEAVLKTVRSEMLISLLMFSMLYLGFSLAKIRYALAFAIITTVFDALPAVGTGLVLAPYAAIMFFTGSGRSGVILLVLWGLTTVARQIIEPKLIGGSCGVPSVVSLFFMYVCIKLFGAAGAVVSPLLITVVSVFAGEKRRRA